ncbi:glutaminase [Garicola koreensis]|uniref:Glutaminase n=1 Tax=Garicola koreensis TaxID=1262554 RepID=A0A7W5Y0A6_9MICC|nr:glutaminase [Garicola koreensis]MBB3668241.1 glutaminase [Garicola koreensis]
MASSPVNSQQAEGSSAVARYLRQVLQDCGEDTSGSLAADLPAPGSTDPALHALALVTPDGAEYSAGDNEHLFTMQSISKPFVYALAIDDVGLDRINEVVGQEPSGEAFNELSLEGGTGRPLNPMINAGALVTHQLVDYRDHRSHEGDDQHDGDGQEPSSAEQARRRSARILAGLSAFAARQLQVDQELAEHGARQDYRNLAIANMLKSHQVLAREPLEVLHGYSEQCSVLVTVQDIARMAATLANHGLNPDTGQRVVSDHAARQTLSVMATCGMYDGSGRWLAQIGIPAKSGISGGIIGVLPGRMGLASFAPRLDEEGNSVQGVEMFQRLSHDLDFHLMARERRNVTEILQSFPQ